MNVATEPAPPTTLQLAAIDCIRRCKQELANSGYYVRSAMELEFCAKDKDGNIVELTLTPVGRLIPKSQVEEWLRHALGENGQYLQQLGHEALGGKGFYARLSPQVRDQYEIKIAEPTGLLSSPEDFDPENIAHTTYLLRNNLLQKAIDAIGNESHTWLDFTSFPTRVPDEGQEAPEGQGVTSGIHVNVSLYDKEGKNHYSTTTLASDLQLLCGWAMLQLQKETWPLVIDRHAEKRIYANNSAPGGLGGIIATTTDEINGDAGKNNHAGNRPISMRVIKPSLDKVGAARIENRLPGADADPYVAMALTMASLVYGVKLSQGKDVPDFLKTPARGSQLKDKILAVKEGNLASPNQEHVHAMQDVLGETLVNALYEDPARVCHAPAGWGKSRVVETIRG